MASKPTTRYQAPDPLILLPGSRQCYDDMKWPRLTTDGLLVLRITFSPRGKDRHVWYAVENRDVEGTPLVSIRYYYKSGDYEMTVSINPGPNVQLSRLIKGNATELEVVQLALKTFQEACDEPNKFVGGFININTRP